ncbi:MAG: DEAD/DEAH box helicase [Alistipes onderdonkii]
MIQLEEFGALGLTERTLEAIRAKGFETPSPIQKLTIPVLLDTEKTNDIIAQAQTGTGKTAAFGLPILERLRPLKGTTQALILVPTRTGAAGNNPFAQHAAKLSVSPIYGGASMSNSCAVGKASTSWWARPAASSTTCGAVRSTSRNSNT